MSSYSLHTDNGSLNVNLTLKDPKIVNFDMQVNNVTSDSININISNFFFMFCIKIRVYFNTFIYKHRSHIS